MVCFGSVAPNAVLLLGRANRITVPESFRHPASTSYGGVVHYLNVSHQVMLRLKKHRATYYIFIWWEGHKRVEKHMRTKKRAEWLSQRLLRAGLKSEDIEICKVRTYREHQPKLCRYYEA